MPTDWAEALKILMEIKQMKAEYPITETDPNLLPACMAPDGADPCGSYLWQHQRILALEAENYRLQRRLNWCIEYPDTLAQMAARFAGAALIALIDNEIRPNMDGILAMEEDNAQR